jgi:hypothetical protein
MLAIVLLHVARGTSGLGRAAWDHAAGDDRREANACEAALCALC